GVHAIRPVVHRHPAVLCPAKQLFDLRAYITELHGRPVDPPGNCLGRLEQGLVERLIHGCLSNILFHHCHPSGSPSSVPSLTGPSSFFAQQACRCLTISCRLWRPRYSLTSRLSTSRARRMVGSGQTSGSILKAMASSTSVPPFGCRTIFRWRSPTSRCWIRLNSPWKPGSGKCCPQGPASRRAAASCRLNSSTASSPSHSSLPVRSSALR